MQRFLLALVVLTGQTLLASPAWAACESEIAKAKAARGLDVAPAFAKVAACNPDMAGATFEQLLPNTVDVAGLTELSMVAIEKDIWGPVWEMVGKLPNYEDRDNVANAIGERCEAQPKVVTFLQAAYSLRPQDFRQWDNALIACKAPALNTWMQAQIEAPPESTFNEKYDTLAQIYVARNRAEALPSLVIAAAKGASSGPFPSILNYMDTAVAPNVGESPDPELQKQLDNSLVDLANQLPPEQARVVADRLANRGQDALAASLLPKLYPDRVQSGGRFIYGAAVVEEGDCGGAKQAVVHLVVVSEPGKVWAINTVQSPALTALKPALKKCTVTSPWPVIFTPEPLTAPGDVNAFGAEIQKTWEEKGYTVKIKGEKQINL